MTPQSLLEEENRYLYIPKLTALVVVIVVVVVVLHNKLEIYKYIRILK